LLNLSFTESDPKQTFLLNFKATIHLGREEREASFAADTTDGDSASAANIVADGLLKIPIALRIKAFLWSYDLRA